MNFFEALFWDREIKFTLELFNLIVNESLSKEIIDDLDLSPISAAMRMWYNSGPEFRDGWSKLVHRLLAFVPDLHKYSVSIARQTMLYQILDIADCPVESGELGEGWLGILEDFGIDIGEYLRTERVAQHEESSPILTPKYDRYTKSSRYSYIIFSESSPRVSLDWYIDPEGHASEVLHEFRNLGPSSHNPSQDYKFPERIVNWPHFYPRWESCHDALSWGWITEDTVNSLSKLFQNRFERRWLKKAQKLDRAQGIGKIPRVPGAWID